MAPISFNGGQHSGFFTADVSTGSPVHGDVQFEIAAKAVFAEDAFGVGPVDGVLQSIGAEDELTANVYVGMVNADRLAADDDAFKKKVRVFLHDQTILEGTRLGFVSIDGEILRLVRLLGYKAPFHACGESCSASASKIGGLDRFDEIIRLPVVEGLASLLVAPFALVELEGVAFIFMDVGSENLAEAHQAPPFPASWRNCSIRASTSSRLRPSW